MVTHDVEAYSVVAGNPAKEIKKRFPAEIIDKLKEIEWYNLPKSFLAKHEELFRLESVSIELMDRIIKEIEYEKTINAGR